MLSADVDKNGALDLNEYLTWVRHTALHCVTLTVVTAHYTLSQGTFNWCAYWARPADQYWLPMLLLIVVVYLCSFWVMVGNLQQKKR